MDCPCQAFKTPELEITSTKVMSLERIFSLQGSTVLVNVACRGIGQALAVGGADADIVITSRNLDQLSTTQSLIRKKGNAICLLNWMSPLMPPIQNLSEKIHSTDFNPDVLINNAGP